MKPELYLDRRSPPVRSVLLLIEALGIEVTEKPIDLSIGEMFSEQFLKVFEIGATFLFSIIPNSINNYSSNH